MSLEKKPAPDDQVSRYLHGLDFPADRDRLIRKARENGASEAVLRMLEALPAQDFGSMAEILKRYERR
ncbi:MULTISPECIES: DUF2795 domain-containing protein [Pseudomonas]|uniref:DUF2795 domain-containing protein n=1 Tax=Pseudomonas flexibilis TaxID=706570 RepID=A0A0B2D6B6_9PSED|nr:MULTISPECIES: DUF2795 domain-containing protein [Pseudomonas]KHL70099.1 hypothetical protein SF06_11890 [Pseudomonas flexibilis]KHO64139.1 hypothetical protein PT85_12860 [Pseudomonas flexibilis]SCY16499.1 Protein of unknown function [Pseudomonas flexibilis]SIQ01953.1 Protein of unknown function [Pseudomonas flexibilis]